MSGPLSHIRVVEWGECLTAPFAGKVLRDLGAQVVKVESLPAGDYGRELPPFAGGRPGPGRSLFFEYLNGGKRSAALDLREEAGRELLLALLAEADALLEDRPLREKEAWGLTYDRLHERFPSLVVATVSPYGQNGPYRYDPGYPSVSFHMSGAGWTTPPSVESVERPPLSLPGRPAAVMGGLAAAAALQTALMACALDGQGRHADVSEVEAMLPTMATPINRFSFEGKVEPRTERVHGVAPFDHYRVKDGYASIFLVQEAHWERFVAMMGNPEWAKAEMFKDRRMRAQYQEDMAALMEPWLRQQANEELYVKAQALDIPIGPARRMDEVLRDAHFAARGVFRRAQHPEMGATTYLHPPYRSSDGPWETPAPAPYLGQHTAEVLMSWLGLCRRDVAGLAAAGLV